MPVLPNPDPGIGPSFTLCVGDTWRPPIIGLLEDMLTHRFWEEYAEKLGVVVNDDDIRGLEHGVARIINRIGVEAVEDGCADLEPSTVPPEYGTLYSKHYTFVGSNVPSGWTVIRGTPQGSGLHSADFNATSGWQRRATAELTLSYQCHALTYLHTSYMNLSLLANSPLFLGGYFFGSGGRLAAQSEPLPEAGTWNMQISNALQAATANKVLVLIQVDYGKPGQSDLLGECWLQSVDLEAYSPFGNPFP